MLKETRVYDHPLTLRSDDGKAWFSRPQDLLAYRRRAEEKNREFEALAKWLKESPESYLRARRA
jgi:hypothetical protein